MIISGTFAHFYDLFLLLIFKNISLNNNLLTFAEASADIGEITAAR
jgi:hypothetical protein